MDTASVSGIAPLTLPSQSSPIVPGETGVGSTSTTTAPSGVTAPLASPNVPWCVVQDDSNDASVLTWCTKQLQLVTFRHDWLVLTNQLESLVISVEPLGSSVGNACYEVKMKASFRLYSSDIPLPEIAKELEMNDGVQLAHQSILDNRWTPPDAMICFVQPPFGSVTTSVGIDDGDKIRDNAAFNARKERFCRCMKQALLTGPLHTWKLWIPRLVNYTKRLVPLRTKLLDVGFNLPSWRTSYQELCTIALRDFRNVNQGQCETYQYGYPDEWKTLPDTMVRSAKWFMLQTLCTEHLQYDQHCLDYTNFHLQRLPKTFYHNSN